MFNYLPSLWTVFTHSLALQAGFLLTSLTSLTIIASMLRMRRAPATTLAWIMAMVLIPPIGIPLYFVFGERRLDTLQKRKGFLKLAAAPADSQLPVEPLGQNLLANAAIPNATTGNLFNLHKDGEDAFADLMAAIDGAKKRIHIETYEMKADPVGRAIIEKLAARAKQGVEVRLLLDALGAFSMSRFAIWRFKRAGGKFAWFLRVWPLLPARSNLRNHRKWVVADGERLWAGVQFIRMC